MTKSISFFANLVAIVFLVVSILLPMGQVQAANVYALNNLSWVLTNSYAPTTGTAQTISFTTSSSGGGVPLNSSFAITFPSSPNTWNISSVVIGDVSITVGGTGTGYGLSGSAGASQWGWSKSGQVMTFTAPTSGTPVINSSTAVVVTISNASSHFTTPAAGSYTLSIASGANDIGSATVAIAANVINIAASVSQTMSFSLGGSTAVALGNLSSSTISTGTSTFSVGTNAPSGVAVSYTGTSLSYTTSPGGSHTITACSSTGAASSPGSEQFGITLGSGAPGGAAPSGSAPKGTVTTTPDDYSFPSSKYVFNSGDQIAGSTSPINSTTFTVVYMANISPLTPAGVYVTNLTYTATSTF